MSTKPSLITAADDELLEWMLMLRDFVAQHPHIGSEVDLTGQADSVHLFCGDDPTREDAHELIISYNDATQTYWVSNLSLWREELLRRSRVVNALDPADDEPIVFRIPLINIDDVIATIEGEYGLG